ncbi:MAG TPA: VOC family protein [Bacteroidales bacterium]|nr:VOC family protein [Bacteroidales bacterium]
MSLIKGLHHITALTSDAQKNLDFYSGILGLRFVKRTVNFDAPDVYHLYYGDESGSPGTVLTFFPFPGIRRGRKGNSQATVITFSVNENALDYWMKRLRMFGVSFSSPQHRFGEIYIHFEDFDGLSLEIAGVPDDERTGYVNGNIPAGFELKGFHCIQLNEDNYNNTASFLTDQMNHTLIAEDNNRFRFSSEKGAGYVDILFKPGESYGVNGSGSIHHIAFATDDYGSQHKFRDVLLNHGAVSPTDVIDRQYFKSVYFREPGGILFEVATKIPGFTIDEPLEHLGEKLMLPVWEEKNRSRIEGSLPELTIDNSIFRDVQAQFR